jgi:hypothetical protein
VELVATFYTSIFGSAFCICSCRVSFEKARAWKIYLSVTFKGLHNTFLEEGEGLCTCFGTLGPE